MNDSVNFLEMTPTDKQKATIAQTAQSILDARSLYPESSLADLYNESLMPPELRKAHQANDRAVMQTYGFEIKGMTEANCVAELMRMYRNLKKIIVKGRYLCIRKMKKILFSY